MSKDLKSQLKALTGKPGVYLMKDEESKVLYVGKAKSLKKRVRGYFDKNLGPANKLDASKAEMIEKVREIETIVTDSEHEALMLEANLIRHHLPPYNVLLTDDKHYLFIKLTKDNRIFLGRKILRDKAKYFGPYSSAYSARETVKFLRRIFGLKGEKDNEREQIFPHPLFRTVPLASTNPDKESSGLDVKIVEKFLRGDRGDVIKILEAGMKQAAEKKSYEQAAVWRDQLRAINRLDQKQKVALVRKDSFDVISGAKAHNRSAVNVFKVREGKLLGKETFLLKQKEDTLMQDVIEQFVSQYYSDVWQSGEGNMPKLVVAPYPLSLTKSKSMVPRRGVKKQLIEMGEENAKALLHQEHVKTDDPVRLSRALKDLADNLGIEESLNRIETYDISNTQGSLATGSMIVFIDGSPSKKDYRKFRIKSGDTPDDFRMMAEVLGRRFSNRHDDWTKPNLVLIDGGKGQLNAVRKVVGELGLDLNIASIAKREEILFIGDREVRLPYSSDALYLVQRMRDEAHRVTIGYHKQLRSKKAVRSWLDDIPGIGPKTKKQLLRKFGSVKKIREAGQEEIAEVIGKAKAKDLSDYL